MAAKLTFVEQEWARQSNETVRLNLSNPLAKNCVLAVNFANKYDAVNKRIGTSTSGVTTRATEYGLGAYCSGGENVSFSVPPAIGSVPPGVTVFVQFVIISQVDYGAIYRKNDAAFTLSASLNGSGVFNYRGINGNTGGPAPVAPSKSATTGKLCSFAYVASSDNFDFVFIDGEAGSAGIPGLASNSDGVFCFGLGGGGYSNPNIIYLNAFVFSGAKTLDELRRLANNPWQIFEPEQIPLFKPVTSGATNLSIFDSSHAHAGDNLAFSLDTYLAAQDSAHAHSAENLALDASTAISLILSDAFHGLSSDVIDFITGSYLQVADSIHGHSADVLSLATASFLVVAEALHAHAADNITLDTSNSTPLTTQDTLHAHSADNNALTLDTWLAIVEAVHAQSADTVSISSEELLAIADALHSQASDALVLSLPNAPGTCPTAAEIAAAILAAAQITPIHSDIRKVNNLTVDGTGTDGDPWGPV